MSLMSLTAVELGKKIKAKEVTVEAAVREALDAVHAKEEQVHSFVTVDEEGALARAKEVQAQIDAGELIGPLAGVPEIRTSNPMIIAHTPAMIPKMPECFILK